MQISHPGNADTLIMERSPQHRLRWEHAPTEELSPASLSWSGRCAVPRPSLEELRFSAVAGQEDLADAPTEEISLVAMRALTMERGWFDVSGRPQLREEAPITCVQTSLPGRLLRAGLLFTAIWLPPALLLSMS